MYVPVRMTAQSIADNIAKRLTMSCVDRFIAARNFKSNMTLEIEIGEYTNNNVRDIIVYVVKESPLVTMYRESARCADLPVMYDFDGVETFKFLTDSSMPVSEWLNNSELMNVIDTVCRQHFSVA